MPQPVDKKFRDYIIKARASMNTIDKTTDVKKLKEVLLELRWHLKHASEELEVIKDKPKIELEDLFE